MSGSTWRSRSTWSGRCTSRCRRRPGWAGTPTCTTRSCVAAYAGSRRPRWWSGAQDGFVPAVHAETYAAEISGARLVVIEGAAHLLPLERPAELAALVRAFLAEEPAWYAS